MSWHDMFLDRRIAAEDARNAISQIYEVQPEQVEVVVSQEYPDYSKLGPDVRVLCWMSEHPGDFPLRLEIMPWREELFSRVTQETEGHICELLNCRALVGSEESNPYIWILISDRTHFKKVKVDPDVLDTGENPDEQGLVIVLYLD